MKTSLKNATENTDEFPPVADEEALASMTGEDTALAEVSSVTLSLGSVEGKVDSSDLIIPRINIVQGVGGLSDDFKKGSVVLNRETVLAGPEEPLSVTVLNIKKTYEEYIFPYDKDARAKQYETLEDVVADGKVIKWINDVRPTAREVATAILLVERPENVDDLSFSRNYLGKEYAIMLMVMRGTAYTYGAKKIFSANSIELAGKGLLSGKWSFSTEPKQMSGNTVFVPNFRLLGENDPAFVDAIKADLS